jgi:phage-related protein (TIGR01555 family)
MARTPKGTFEKGSSGNPGGRPKAQQNRLDGWESALTGIGSALHDKRTSHALCPTQLSYEQCTQIYEGDDFGKRAAAGPIEDAFRPGYEISISDEGSFADLKEDIENRLRELKVDKVVKKALIQKRALGGSAILIGVRDNKTMDRPLDLKSITDIEFLTNLEPRDLTPHVYYNQPHEPKFGEVKLWQLNVFGGMVGALTVKTAATNEQAKSILIHESRLVLFRQDRVSKYTSIYNEAGQYWGLSIYTQIYDILRDFNISWSAAGLLITDFSQAVFSIEGLSQLVMRDEDRLRARMQAMEMGRSVARAVLIDTAEKFERQSTNLSGLPELLNQLSRRFAAAIGTPLSVLMGGGAKGDQSDVGDDLRYYYDTLSTIEREDIGPVIRFFAEIIMRGLRQRKIPKHWGIRWHPLWQQTDEQKANSRLAQARVDAIYIKHGVLDPDIVAKIRFGGEYSYDTPLSPGYKAPGFMALPPAGVVVDGMDPKTGLPPGELPPAPSGAGPSGGTNAAGAGAHGVGGYSRRNPRQTSMAGHDPTAGGDTPGKADAENPENVEDDLMELELHDEEHPCGQPSCQVCQ